MPTIFDREKSNLSAESKHLKLPVSVLRKSATKRVYQQDQFKLFEEQDKIKSFDDINSTLTPPGDTFQKYDDLVVFYRLETVLNVTEVTDRVLVDRDLSVKLFFKGSPLPLPQWFHHGRDCHLTKKSMMQNFLNYIRLEGEQKFSILEELKELKFFFFFFSCYLAAPLPTLGHYRGGSLTHPMLINCVICVFDPKVTESLAARWGL